MSAMVMGRSLRRDQRGLSTVEYTVLLVLILAGAITLWKNLGQDLHTQLGDASKTFNTQVKPAGGGAGGGAASGATGAAAGGVGAAAGAALGL